MNYDPLVTVSLLSYNRVNDLKETLSKIEDIKYSNLEILIVDNNSNDGSAEYIKSYSNMKIRYFISKKNLGIGYGRMKQFSLARGEIVITIDDDCFIKPDVVEKTVKIFNNNKNLAAISFGNLNPLLKFSNKFYLKETEIDNSINYDDSYDGVLNLCSSAWKKSALNKINFDKISLTKLYLNKESKKILYGCIESDLSYQLCSTGYNTVAINNLIAFHKVSPTNRHNEYRTIESTVRYFRMVVNYYPYIYLFKELFTGIYYCIYNSLIQMKPLYIKCLFISMLSNSNNIFNKIRLTNKIYLKMRRLSIQPVFGGKL